MKQRTPKMFYFLDKISTGCIVTNGPGAAGRDQGKWRELPVILQDPGPSYTAPLLPEKIVPHWSCFGTTFGTRLGSEACQSSETLSALIV